MRQEVVHVRHTRLFLCQLFLVLGHRYPLINNP
jgi:hypothetical protein